MALEELGVRAHGSIWAFLGRMPLALGACRVDLGYSSSPAASSADLDNFSAALLSCLLDDSSTDFVGVVQFLELTVIYLQPLPRMFSSFLHFHSLLPFGLANSQPGFKIQAGPSRRLSLDLDLTVFVP